METFLFIDTKPRRLSLASLHQAAYREKKTVVYMNTLSWIIFINQWGELQILLTWQAAGTVTSLRL